MTPRFAYRCCPFRRAQGLVEYLLLVVLVAIVVIGAITLFGGALSRLLSGLLADPDASESTDGGIVWDEDGDLVPPAGSPAPGWPRTYGNWGRTQGESSPSGLWDSPDIAAARRSYFAYHTDARDRLHALDRLLGPDGPAPEGGSNDPASRFSFVAPADSQEFQDSVRAWLFGVLSRSEGPATREEEAAYRDFARRAGISGEELAEIAALAHRARDLQRRMEPRIDPAGREVDGAFTRLSERIRIAQSADGQGIPDAEAANLRQALRDEIETLARSGDPALEAEYRALLDDFRDALGEDAQLQGVVGDLARSREALAWKTEALLGLAGRIVSRSEWPELKNAHLHDNRAGIAKALADSVDEDARRFAEASAAYMEGDARAGAVERAGEWLNPKQRPNLGDVEDQVAGIEKDYADLRGLSASLANAGTPEVAGAIYDECERRANELAQKLARLENTKGKLAEKRALGPQSLKMSVALVTSVYFGPAAIKAGFAQAGVNAGLSLEEDLTAGRRVDPGRALANGAMGFAEGATMAGAGKAGRVLSGIVAKSLGPTGAALTRTLIEGGFGGYALGAESALFSGGSLEEAHGEGMAAGMTGALLHGGLSAVGQVGQAARKVSTKLTEVASRRYSNQIATSLGTPEAKSRFAAFEQRLDDAIGSDPVAKKAVLREMRNVARDPRVAGIDKWFANVGNNKGDEILDFSAELRDISRRAKGLAPDHRIQLGGDDVERVSAHAARRASRATMDHKVVDAQGRTVEVIETKRVRNPITKTRELLENVTDTGRKIEALKGVDKGAKKVLSIEAEVLPGPVSDGKLGGMRFANGKYFSPPGQPRRWWQWNGPMKRDLFDDFKDKLQGGANPPEMKKKLSQFEIAASELDETTVQRPDGTSLARYERSQVTDAEGKVKNEWKRAQDRRQ